MTEQRQHPRDPLHGVTLETIVKYLEAKHGWHEMGNRIPIRCFLFDPSVKSSLTFLRKTPWAREKLEAWYATDVRGGFGSGPVRGTQPGIDAKPRFGSGPQR